MKTMGRDLIRRMKENEKCMRGSDNALDYQEIIGFCKSIQKCLRANYWLWNSYFSRRKCSHLVLPFWYHPRNDFARLSTNQIRRRLFLVHSVLFDWYLSALKWPQYPTVNWTVYNNLHCLLGVDEKRSKIISYQTILIVVQQRVGSTIDLVIFFYCFKLFSFLLWPCVLQSKTQFSECFCHLSQFYSTSQYGLFPNCHCSSTSRFSFKNSTIRSIISLNLLDISGWMCSPCRQFI